MKILSKARWVLIVGGGLCMFFVVVFISSYKLHKQCPWVETVSAATSSTQESPVVDVATADKLTTDLLVKGQALSKEAELYFLKAIEINEKAINDNPNGDVSKLMFKTALIYDSELHDYDKAMEWYKKFLAKYPNVPGHSNFARTVIKQLQQLGTRLTTEK
jgi:tetratricopeptide (TPR) repeat protein